MKSRYFSTQIGLLSLIFWSFNGVFTEYLHNIPTFEILTTVFSVSFCLAFAKIWYCNEWYKLKQPLVIWLIGILGLYGNDVLYILAFKNAPAAHADLINYLWPLLVVSFSFLLPKEKFCWKYTLSSMLGFVAVLLLVLLDSQSSFNSNFLLGYFYALMDAIAWTTFVLVVRYYGKMPVEMIGMFCGFGALFAFVMHNAFEVTVTPNFMEIIVLISMGITTQGLAYYFWAYAIQKGNFKLLSVFSYLIPVTSIGLLILFHMASFTPVLLISTALVSIAGLIAVLQPKDFHKISKWFQNTRSSH